MRTVIAKIDVRFAEEQVVVLRAGAGDVRHDLRLLDVAAHVSADVAGTAQS